MNEDIESLIRKKMQELMGSSREERGRSGQEVIIEVGDDNFEEEVVERSKKVPVVVDFWAPWCMPCRLIGPVLEKLAREYGGKFVLAKVNVDMNPVVSQRYMIMSIPSVKLFKNGRVVDEFVGAIPEQYIRIWLERNIRKGS